ncbi:hypothetical protein SANTM175S_03470 [Streptomyces antimycoticus]
MGGVERGTGAAELRRGGSARRRRRSAPEDVAAVRQVLRAGDEPSVVAHSCWVSRSSSRNGSVRINIVKHLHCALCPLGGTANAL